MKKLIMVIALAAIVATGTAFADHPDGWGIGVMGSYDMGFIGGYHGNYGPALSIKFPKLPVYWGIGMGFGWHGFRLGVTGDYYIIDKTFAPDIGLGWYFGVGGFVNMHFWSGWGGIDFGVRVPVGLSWMPINWLELFIDIAPSLGVGIYNGAGFYFGLPLGIGARFWF